MSLTNVLKKYSQPTPRYTSYPTVPAWTDAVTAKEYRQNLNTVVNTSCRGEPMCSPISLYFHLPFCENQCHYCGCSRIVTSNRNASAGYMQRIVREIGLVSDFIVGANPCIRPFVSQIHLGGGSPNFFQPTEISAIMQAARNHFSIAKDAEVAIEINPRPHLEKFYDNLAREGFNRISLGVQDFNDNVQKRINRFQTFDTTRSTINYLRSLGIKHINLDLVCGLPGQSVATFADTLKKTIELSPSRIALYAYAHLPWSFPFQRSFDEKDLPSTDERIRIFELAYNYFTQHGYESIGMDHFARSDDPLCAALKDGTIQRNFMGYTTQANTHQIGFGMTAISFVNGNYFQNQKELAAYEQCIDKRELATAKGRILSRDDAIRRDLIMQIMCQQRIDIPALEKKYNIVFRKYFEKEIPLLNTFVDDQLLKISNTEITVIPPGHLILRNIAAVFDVYLGNNDRKRFSKTI